MTKKILKNNKVYHQCEECKLKFKERAWAEKCEKWCKENHSCNLEITKHSIKLK